MLWVDKHRPKSLDSLDVHPELTTRLVAMVSEVRHMQPSSIPLEMWKDRRAVHRPGDRKGKERGGGRDRVERKRERRDAS